MRSSSPRTAFSFLISFSNFFSQSSINLPSSPAALLLRDSRLHLVRVATRKCLLQSFSSPISVREPLHLGVPLRDFVPFQQLLVLGLGEDLEHLVAVACSITFMAGIKINSFRLECLCFCFSLVVVVEDMDREGKKGFVFV